MVAVLRSFPAMAPPRRHSYMVASKPNTFGDRLRRLRIQRGWVQTQLADVSGVGQSVISKYERGEVQYPDPEAIYRLEESLGVARDSLMQLAMADHMNRQRDVPEGSLVIFPDDENFDTVRTWSQLGHKAKEELRRLGEYLLKEQRARGERDESSKDSASG